ncbi:MAG: TIGR03546 family protein [Fuerstiella sp.]
MITFTVSVLRMGYVMFLIIRPIRLAMKALIKEATPGQMAFGFALGVLIGLVPKGNLLAVVLGIILAASRANLGIAAATILIFSFLSPCVDPLSDVIGGWLLSQPRLQSLWTDLYNTPFMPWTAFYNTIVLGSFVLGLALLYPTYRLSRPVFARYTIKLSRWAKRLWLTRVLLGVEWADRLGTSGSS